MIKKILFISSLASSICSITSLRDQPVFASTKYIVRSDMSGESGYKSFNDLVSEINKKRSDAALSKQIRMRLNLRLATMLSINDRVVDCLVEKVVEQLAKVNTVSDVEKQKIREEITHSNPQNPAYIEQKFIRNKQPQKEDYNNLVKDGVDITSIQEIVAQLVPCDFFKNIVESRFSTWLFGGAQFFIKTTVQTYLNRYLLLTEEAIRQLFSNETAENKEQVISSLTEKVRSMKIGDPRLESQMFATFKDVLHKALERQKIVGEARGSELSPDDLLLFSISMSAISH